MKDKIILASLVLAGVVGGVQARDGVRPSASRSPDEMTGIGWGLQATSPTKLAQSGSFGFLPVVPSRWNHGSVYATLPTPSSVVAVYGSEATPQTIEANKQLRQASIDALVAQLEEHYSGVDPLELDRVAELEQQLADLRALVACDSVKVSDGADDEEGDDDLSDEGDRD